MRLEKEGQEALQKYTNFVFPSAALTASLLSASLQS